MVWKFIPQDPGIRYVKRKPPLWMIMNLRDSKCWCGKPKELWDQFQRKYCCGNHAEWWFYYFRAYWDSFRRMVYREEKFTCQECGLKIKEKENDIPKCDWEVDHILAISLGGDCYDRENVRLLCRKCHNAKTGIDLRKLSLKKKNQTVLLPIEVKYVV